MNRDHGAFFSVKSPVVVSPFAAFASEVVGS